MLDFGFGRGGANESIASMVFAVQLTNPAAITGIFYNVNQK